MDRNRKLFICFVMFIVVIIAGFFETTIMLNKETVPDPATMSDAEDDESDQVIIQASIIGAKAIITDEIDREIERILKSMPIEEKVGQLFFIKNDNRFDESVLEDYPVGGIILFASDFAHRSPEQLKESLAAFQAASKYPLLIGVDEEGGTVVRLSKNRALADHEFQSPQDLYNSGGYDAIRNDTKEKAELLLSYGVNVNFAPVCDISVNKRDFMYKRSFGKGAEETATYVSIVVEIMNNEKIGCVLKHFPGYGNNGDTHSEIIHDRRDYQTIETQDFKPFIAGINAGAGCVLVSHNIVDCMDSQWPASLSVYIHNLLRNELAFDGVIITDDLMMGGVSKFVNDSEAPVLALKAGNDMLLSTNYSVHYRAVLDAVSSGDITEERIDESVRRVLRWKYTLGLMSVHE
ncbi:MAG: beta-hexosaminidase [Lachnospiraceae bacterium]|nr:beta-hexosaminidase [Lachnospiraceae bacterium]